MGKFTYDSNVRVDFEDRLLAHLQHVISTKLRRGESFMFTWKEDASTGEGRTSVWLHPAASMTFRFYGGRTPALSHSWLHALTHTANSPHGLYAVPEPGDRVGAGPAARDPMRFRVIEDAERRGGGS